MKVNLYSGLSNAERKKVDRELRRRMRPKMAYQTHFIVPGEFRSPPYARPLKVEPYTRGLRFNP